VILVGTSTIDGSLPKKVLTFRGMEVIHQPQPQEAAWQVMKLVSDGKAEIAMKGKVETSDFLRAALNKELGYEQAACLPTVGCVEIPGFDRLILYQRRGAWWSLLI